MAAHNLDGRLRRLKVKIPPTLEEQIGAEIARLRATEEFAGKSDGEIILAALRGGADLKAMSDEELVEEMRGAVRTWDVTHGVPGVGLAEGGQP